MVTIIKVSGRTENALTVECGGEQHSAMSLCIYAQTRKERPLLGVRRLKRCLPAKTREAKAEQQPGCEEILGAEFWFACDLCDS